MSLTDTNNGFTMPVAPMGYNGGGWGNNGGWGESFWIIILLLLCFNGNWGNSFGGGGMDGMYPWLTQNTNQGFDQSALMGAINGINASINAINPQLCNGFAGVNAAINGGFANAETAASARQMADMNQNFANQQALAAQLNAMQMQQANCCCDTRAAIKDVSYVVATEACADRAAVNDALRDVIASNTANTQGVLNAVTSGIQSLKDQLCADKIDAKNEKIAELQNQLSMAQLAASQNAQTAAIIANNEAQTTALEQYLAPNPKPCYVVPSPYCCNQNYGYGCGA